MTHGEKQRHTWPTATRWVSGRRHLYGADDRSGEPRGGLRGAYLGGSPVIAPLVGERPKRSTGTSTKR